jgi:lipopolysaccharide transport system ATP-binding protein
MGKITVSGLGKAYKQYSSRWDRLIDWVSPGNAKRFSMKRVIEDLNFSVNPGEALGIIGINGAGKSTLLKMIVGTVQPTTGSVEISGKIAALLELGMGFHPDFTGRQNAYMAGQLLGYSSAEMSRLMPEIEAFAEIGDYIDKPVRIYSSGMQMRLAFSVATAHRPDVLIIDEALSVGDAYFQHKSFDRIRQYRNAGTTLLIVSHDKSAIQSICSKAILLNAGKIQIEGKPEEVMDYYNAMLADRENESIQQEVINSDGTIQTRSGTGEAQILDVGIFSVNGKRLEVARVGETVSLKVSAKCNEPLPELVLGYLIKDRLGQAIFGTNTHHCKQALTSLVTGQVVHFSFEFEVNLGPGSYSIAVALHTSDSHIEKNYEWVDRATVFNVVNIGKDEFVGACWLPPRVEKSI